MTGRDRTLISVVVAALVLAAAWFLVLAPQRQEASQLSDDVATQRGALTQAQADAAAGLAAKRGYDRAYTTVARLGAAVPEDDNVPSLLLQVERAAEGSQIDFRELKGGEGSGGQRKRGGREQAERLHGFSQSGTHRPLDGWRRQKVAMAIVSA